MTANQLARNAYFNGTFLSQTDFDVEQRYGLAIERSHYQALFSPGIAKGLRVTVLDGSLLIGAGMAIDKQGRKLINQTTAYLTPPTQQGVYQIWMQYDETIVRSQPGQPVGRIIEVPHFSITPSNAPGNGVPIAIVKVDQDPVTYTILPSLHCGLSIGRVDFPVPNEPPASLAAVWRPDRRTRLEADTRQLTFGGSLSVQTLALGEDQPNCALSVFAKQIGGLGTISSTDVTVRQNSGSFNPPLVVGDQLIVHRGLTGKREVRTVRRVLDNTGVEVDMAFNPPLNDAAHQSQRSIVTSIIGAEARQLLSITTAGSVHIGHEPSLDTDVLTITEDGLVGIHTDQPSTLLEVAGTVMAKAFKGDGSQLTGIHGLWTEQEPNIYYDKGNVGIGLEVPKASLEVVGGNQFPAEGTISNDKQKVTGVGTNFKSNINPGDCLLVGVLPEDRHLHNHQMLGVQNITSDTRLETEGSFSPALNHTVYQVMKPIAWFGAITNPQSGPEPNNGQKPVEPNDPALTLGENHGHPNDFSLGDLVKDIEHILDGHWVTILKLIPDLLRISGTPQGLAAEFLKLILASDSLKKALTHVEGDLAKQACKVLAREWKGVVPRGKVNSILQVLKHTGILGKILQAAMQRLAPKSGTADTTPPSNNDNDKEHTQAQGSPRHAQQPNSSPARDRDQPVHPTSSTSAYVPPILSMLPNQRVGINRTAPAYTLDVSGTLSAESLVVGNQPFSEKEAAPNALQGEIFGKTAIIHTLLSVNHQRIAFKQDGSAKAVLGNLSTQMNIGTADQAITMGKRLGGGPTQKDIFGVTTPRLVIAAELSLPQQGISLTLSAPDHPQLVTKRLKVSDTLLAAGVQFTDTALSCHQVSCNALYAGRTSCQALLGPPYTLTTPTLTATSISTKILNNPNRDSQVQLMSAYGAPPPKPSNGFLVWNFGYTQISANPIDVAPPNHRVQNWWISLGH